MYINRPVYDLAQIRQKRWMGHVNPSLHVHYDNILWATGCSQLPLRAPAEVVLPLLDRSLKIKAEHENNFGCVGLDWST